MTSLRSVMIQFRLTAEEHTQLLAEAARDDRSLSYIVRRRLFPPGGETIVPHSQTLVSTEFGHLRDEIVSDEAAASVALDTAEAGFHTAKPSHPHPAGSTAMGEIDDNGKQVDAAPSKSVARRLSAQQQRDEILRGVSTAKPRRTK